jgi:Dolichyl-phosphate-mannose-protein mannosyltransferase
VTHDFVPLSLVIPLVGLASNGALFLGSFWIVRYGLKQPRGLPACLAAVVVFWTACTIGLESLGTLGILSLGRMAILASAIFALGCFVRLRCGTTDRDPAARSSEASLPWDVILCLAFVLAAALVLGTRSLLLGVKVVSDGPIYHLYFAARWWRAGRVFLVAAPFGETAATYFPANGDLWFTWLMASWGGDQLAKIGQFPFGIIATAAAFGSARSLGAGRPASLVATCWFATSTPLLLFSFEPNVDTIFVAAYLLAAYFILEADRRGGDTAALVLAALAAGQALGTKAVGVVFVPPLIALAIATIWLRNAPPAKKLWQTLVMLTVPLASGGYWFVRNAMVTGNPLYPLDFRLFGHTLWPGWYGPEAMRTSRYHLPLGDWRALVDTMLAVLDPRLAPLWLVSLAVGWAVKSPPAAAPATRRWIAVFALLAVLNVALYWFCIPYRTQQRFMLQALGLGVAPLAMILDRARWLRYLAACLLLLHLLTPECWPFASRESAIPWDLSPRIPNAIDGPLPLLARLALLQNTGDPRAHSAAALSAALLLAMGLAAIGTVWSWNRVFAFPSRRLARVSLAALLTALLVLPGYMDIQARRVDPRLEFYAVFPEFIRGWLALEARSAPDGSRVAYAGTDLPYYLLGRGLRNEVRYVNVDRHRDWLMHDYHKEAVASGQGTWPDSRPGWDRIRTDYRDWLENLDAEGINLLVVTRADPTEGPYNVADAERFPIERHWADTHPDRFEPLYGVQPVDPWFRLYRVRPELHPRRPM